MSLQLYVVSVIIGNHYPGMRTEDPYVYGVRERPAVRIQIGYDGDWELLTTENGMSTEDAVSYETPEAALPALSARLSN
jgi:hypothetical protein